MEQGPTIDKCCKRSWEDLKLIIIEDRLDELGRSNRGQEQMLNHMKWIKSNYTSVKDYILSKVFEFPEFLDENCIVNNTNNDNILNNCNIQQHKDNNNNITSTAQTTNCTTPTKKKVIKPEGIQQKIVFRPNDFPYNTDEIVSHYCLWCLNPMSFQEAKELLSKILNANHDEDFIFFMNPERLQSIKEVSHYHVFIKHLNLNSINTSILSSLTR
eukprot:gene3645-4540_t